jgi:hypothetical protein
MADDTIDGREEPDPAGPAEGSLGLRRRSSPYANVVPSVRGPLKIFREDLEAISDILGGVFNDLRISVIARRGQYLEADNVAELAELADDDITELQFEVSAQGKLEPDSSPGWLKIDCTGFPRCDYMTGRGWGPSEREAIRVGFDYLDRRCRPHWIVRRPWLPVATVFIAIIAALITTLAITEGPVAAKVAIGLFGFAAGGGLAALILMFSASDRIKIVPVYRSQRPPLWRRRRDEIILALFAAALSFGVGVLVGRFSK